MKAQGGRGLAVGAGAGDEQAADLVRGLQELLGGREGDPARLVGTDNDAERANRCDAKRASGLTGGEIVGQQGANAERVAQVQAGLFADLEMRKRASSDEVPNGGMVKKPA